MFIEFINLYQRFIQCFSKIAVPLISMLKICRQPAGALPVSDVEDSEIVSSSGENDRKWPNQILQNLCAGQMNLVS